MVWYSRVQKILLYKIREIRVPKNIRVILIIRVQKSRVQAPRERPAANKIREIRAIRVRLKVRSVCV